MKRFLLPLALFALVTTLFYAARLFIPDEIRIYVGLAIPWLYGAIIIIVFHLGRQQGRQEQINQTILDDAADAVSSELVRRLAAGSAGTDRS